MTPVQLILLLSQLAQAGTELMLQIQKASDLVARLQAEDRDATPEEWAELEGTFAQSKSRLDDAITRAKARKEGLIR